VLSSSADKIEAHLTDEDLVLDVGGWAQPFARADWILDVLPYESRGHYGYAQGSPAEERFSERTWIIRDICTHEPWPFDDGQFDFAICSHTLEDLRDPVWVCSELSRVARAGYVEVPSRTEELTYGIHGPWVGWAHHRWLVDVMPPRLEFVLKTHAIHGKEEFHLPEGYCDELPTEQRVQFLWWEKTLEASERLLIGAEQHDPYMSGFVTERLRERSVSGGRPRRQLRPWRR